MFFAINVYVCIYICMFTIGPNLILDECCLSICYYGPDDIGYIFCINNINMIWNSIFSISIQ